MLDKIISSDYLEPTKMQAAVSEKDLKTSVNNNPVCQIKFTADPAVLVYNDTVYIYGTNDSQQLEHSLAEEDNKYNYINTLNLFSSKDLVNWTDLGEIKVDGWAKNAWAPAICTKKINGKDKFFLYFADSGKGIGVLTADRPEGPFTDPIGRALISRDMPNMEGVWWLFDPAVLNDDDGKSYLYFGGGVNGNSAHPDSARCIELGDDMVSIKGIARNIDAPWLFEDSGINKFGSTYYYSYCANWDKRPENDDSIPPIASIAYMTSSNPLGPFEYKGILLRNPSTGNNHHWIFEFKGKKYIAYHTQMVEEQLNYKKRGYRNIYINEFAMNPDGSIPVQKTDVKGVDQIESFNPYETVVASTIHNSLNVAVLANLSVTPTASEGYVCIKGALIYDGSSFFEAELESCMQEGKIDVYLDSIESKPVCSVPVKDESLVKEKIAFDSDSGIHDIYIKMSGKVILRKWKFIK